MGQWSLLSGALDETPKKKKVYLHLFSNKFLQRKKENRH